MKGITVYNEVNHWLHSQEVDFDRKHVKESTQLRKKTKTNKHWTEED